MDEPILSVLEKKEFIGEAVHQWSITRTNTSQLEEKQAIYSFYWKRQIHWARSGQPVQSH